jgi:dipeptidase D
LNAIPRPSGQEGEAREYVRKVAEAAGAEWVTDRHGNGLARAATRNGEDAEIVAVQAHLDMVCDSAPGVEFDCARDPIMPRRDGDRIFADGTTLGADNGIGVAAALAVLTTPDVVHGPLELIFTVEEETGLRGALAFDVGLLRAQVLLNLDSEDPDALTIGSAGGADALVKLPLEHDRVPPGYKGAELRVSGLTGGHSGTQIRERHANAIKLAASVLDALRVPGGAIRLSRIEGGSAHNAIPRNAVVHLGIAADAEAMVASVVADCALALREEWGADEPGLMIELLQADPPSSVARADALDRLVNLLLEIPHGVLSMSPRFEGTVETSANLAVVRTDDVQVEILTSVRSLSVEAIRDVQARIGSLATEARASSDLTDGYPSWEPREGSQLVSAAQAVYRRVYSREARLDVVHGGLECGLMVSIKPELDAISFGPLIREPHTPNEHVYASTVATTWQLLVALLRDLATTNR